MKKNKYVNIYDKNNNILIKNVEQIFKNRNFITVKDIINKTFYLRDVKVENVRRKYER